MKKLKNNGYLITALIVMALPAILYYQKFSNKFEFIRDEEIWGQFGDFYGGLLNPLLTFITFLFVIKSFNFQKNEAQDLKESKEKDRNETLKNNFDNTFFNYLTQLNNLISAFERNVIDRSKGSEVDLIRSPGREILFSALQISISEFEKSPSNPEKSLFTEGILKIYSKSIYNLLKLILYSNFLNNEEKGKYLDILKAQLVSSEINYLRHVVQYLDKELYEKLNAITFFEDSLNFKKKLENS
ncbi:putative phage abortive infection protein [Leptospira levettii]|uniref:putative phage abortive infection protein n=1 Tax=Leptospira levettii TaxID=2023178 RepID=UPI0014384182|nr:putative phage abortive infection protein [Leptospira levettii]